METDKAISKILQGFQPACVVITANELKIFDQLKQPIAAKHVAKNCNLDPEATERLLNALTSLEVITKENDNITCRKKRRIISSLAAASPCSSGYNYLQIFILFGVSWQHSSNLESS
jgi:hypothetical protein